MGEYKVGDTVKLISKRGFGWNTDGAMDKYCGSVVKIESIASSRFRFAGDEDWWFRPDDIEKLISRAEPKEIKIIDDNIADVGDWRYTREMCLCPKCLGKAGACEGELYKYTLEVKKAGYITNIPISFVVERMEKYPVWLHWLISHGRVSAEPLKKKEPEVIYFVGDTFIHPNASDSTYRISRCGGSAVCIVNISNECYDSAIHGENGEFTVHQVRDPYVITQQEIESMLQRSPHKEGILKSLKERKTKFKITW